MQAKTPYDIVAAYVAGTLTGEDLVFAFNNKLVEKEGKDGELVLTAFGASYLKDVPTGKVVRVSADAIARGLPLWSANQPAQTIEMSEVSDPNNWGASSTLTDAREVEQVTRNAEVRRMLDAAVALPMPVFNAVDHPSHYTVGAVECIDAIEAALTKEEFAGYCKGNAMKYIWRERHKGGAESLQKANWYLNRLVK
jgi:hypothetical protein